MKVSLSNLTDNNLQSFELSKKVKDNFIIEEINSDLKYFEKTDFDYLLRSSIQGEDKETGNITFHCDNTEYQKGAFIKHNEGTFDLRKCRIEKPLHFKNILDCVAEQDINIFDYTPSKTGTIQGIVEFTQYSNIINHFFGGLVITPVITLQMIIDVVGSIPDYSDDGYFPEYVSFDATPKIVQIPDEAYGPQDQYDGHEVSIYVRYIRIKDSIQHNYAWKPIPATTDYFFSLIPGIEYGVPYVTDYVVTAYSNQSYYQKYFIEAGKMNTYSNVPISNTYLINEILENIFICTGKQLISNFFNINPDGSNPVNQAYEFATLYCQGIKICQSYDIIRENAEMDSFGISGLIKTKDFIGNLLNTFNCRIIYDETYDCIRLEHVTYFTRKGANFVTAEIPYELKELKLNANEIDSELFLFALPSQNNDFYQAKITYNTKNLYNEENEKKYQSNLFITDVFGMLNNKVYEEDEAYKKIFFLMATDGENIIGLNTSFQMLTLVKELHNVLRPLREGKIKEEQTTFSGYSIGFSTEIKLLNASYLLWQKLLPFYSIILNEGTFIIDEINYNEKNEMNIKIKK